MKCASCGHHQDFHQHYRPGTDCAFTERITAWDGAQYCRRCWCPNFATPIRVLAWRWIRRALGR